MEAKWLELCLEMLFIAVHIVASLTVLALSNHERSQTLFSDLIISYAILCFAALSLILYDYFTLEQTSEQDLDISCNINFQKIILFETFLSFVMEDNAQRTIYRTRSHQYSESPTQMQLLVNSSRILLNIFFGYWLIISGILLNTFSQASESLLYRLTALLFAYGCFEYVLALLVFPVLTISKVLAKKEATSRLISAIPICRYKLRTDTGGNNGAADSHSEVVVAANTDTEDRILGEDAVCSICLDIYADNDELRVLPCSHLLHKDCVDKWLNIKTSCPLCKREIC